jgi:hypothetical protein
MTESSPPRKVFCDRIILYIFMEDATVLKTLRRWFQPSIHELSNRRLIQLDPQLCPKRIVYTCRKCGAGYWHRDSLCTRCHERTRKKRNWPWPSFSVLGPSRVRCRCGHEWNIRRRPSKTSHCPECRRRMLLANPLSSKETTLDFGSWGLTGSLSDTGIPEVPDVPDWENYNWLGDDTNAQVRKHQKG